MGLAVATWAVMLAAAGPAQAHVVAATSTEIAAGPALAGDGAVFANHGRGGWHVKLLGNTGAVHVLRQFDEVVRQGSTSYPTLAASHGRIAVSDTRLHCYTEPEGTRDSVCDPTRIEYREATPSEATSRSLEICNTPSRPAPPHAIDVTDDAVAYIGCNAEDAGAVVVRSLSDPPAPPFVIRPPDGQVFDAVRIAGPYVAAELPATATNSGNTLLVYDREARQELYRVGDYSSHEGDFALQADGTTVVVRASPDRGPGECLGIGAPEYYTPAEPFAHQLTRRACWPGFALADGRLVYQAYGGARPPRSQLILSDLSGGPELPVAPTSPVDDRTWDLDPTRVAYTDSTCTGYAVVISSLDELRATGVQPAYTCPIRFARTRPVVERRNGILAVRVACPRGCLAQLDLVPVGRRKPRFQYDFTVPASRVKTVTDFRLFTAQDTRSTVVRRRCVITLTSLQPDGTETKVRLVRRLRISKHV